MDQEEHEKVIEWLEECDRIQEKPWLWDFKNCYKVPPSKDSEPKDSEPKDLLSKDSITAFLKYKNGGFKDNTSDFNITKNTGFNADCDTQSDKPGIKSGKKLPFSDLYDEERNIEDQPYLAFDVVESNKDAFRDFAKLTHTIGNFTVLPHWMNTARYNFSKDYWDITLLSLQEWLNPTTPTAKAWINFVEMFYLQPYVNKDYQTQLFWESHSYKKLLPDNQDFPIFLKAVNERIEERGKYMIKQICDRLNRTDFNFYKEIRDMDKIRFSDEF